MREDAGERGWNKRRGKMRDRKRGEEEEKERKRERGNGGAVSETTPSRNLDEETFECTPEGGGDHAVRDTMRSIGQLPASYFSLQFFPTFFFTLFQRRSLASERATRVVKKGGRCARHVAAETFVIRDGAGEGRVFAARRMSGGGWSPPFECANARPTFRIFPVIVFYSPSSPRSHHPQTGGG